MRLASRLAGGSPQETATRSNETTSTEQIFKRLAMHICQLLHKTNRYEQSTKNPKLRASPRAGKTRPKKILSLATWPCVRKSRFLESCFLQSKAALCYAERLCHVTAVPRHSLNLRLRVLRWEERTPRSIQPSNAARETQMGPASHLAEQSGKWANL